MFKLYIADDEAIIREGLRQILDWNAIGFEIVGEGASGKTAFDDIVNLNPDLILIDIQMPGMSGLDTIFELRTSGFTGKIIIISGFSNFDYAQKAIQYGVQYYLTKPIDKNELLEIVSQLKSTIEKENLSISTSNTYRQKAYSPIMNDIFNNTCDYSQIDADGLSLSQNQFQVVIFDKKATPSISYSQYIFGKDINNTNIDIIEEKSREIILLKGEYSLQKFEHFLNNFMNTQFKRDEKLLSNMFFTYGRTVNCLQDIHISYCEALTLMERQFFSRPEQHYMSYISLPDISNYSTVINAELLNTYSSKIFDTVSAFSLHKTIDALNELEEIINLSSDSIDAIKLFFADLFLQIKERIKTIYTTVNIPISNNSDILKEISSKQHLFEIVRFLSEQFELIISFIGSSSNSTVLDDIVYYINQNYARNITLEGIAPLFGYNSSYLGKIFTRNMGESFNSYLERIRIEQSKRLLVQGNIKVYTIAEMVGFRNVDYFYLKFKKYVGMTPAAYRRQQKNDSEE